MLHGRFGDTSSAPYIEGYIYLPRFDITGLISFLIDSGSDITVMMPVDTVRLGIDLKLLENKTESEGIGGLAIGFVEPAIISFSDRNFTFSYAIEIEISELTSHNFHFPSLLGRDIINRWRCTLDFQRNKIRVAPRSWDYRGKIT